MTASHLRFSGIQRLYGVEGAARLQRSHVCVVGIGGVGSWAVEALARSGIGKLTLVDLDDVCVSNVNRQIHALDGEIGKPKIEVMAQRVRAISPDCEVFPHADFFTEATADRLLAVRFDFLLDAIDSVANKSLLAALCRDRGIPLVMTGSAGGRRDPSGIRIADLAESTHDRLLQKVRKYLRSHFGFPREKEQFRIPCVYSPEPVIYPQKDGTLGARPEPGTELRLDCDSGFGTACFVTGSFGFHGAGFIVSRLALPGSAAEPSARKA